MTDDEADLLGNTIKQMREAVNQTRMAYEFSAGTYTASAFQCCLAAAEALDQYIGAMADSAGELPKIIAPDDTGDDPAGSFCGDDSDSDLTLPLPF
jgi:hypothetical protein